MIALRKQQIPDHLQQFFTSSPRIKPKDDMLIPHRFAFAAQADGWYLRSDVIWAKKNCMPESVTDRPTKAHEYIFLLAKSEKYYYDAEAIREPLKKGAAGSTFTNGKTGANGMGRVSTKERIEPDGRNRRSVWHLSSQPYPGSHFAVFPQAIPETCIKAGSSEKGVCPECGKPWERVTEQVEVTKDRQSGQPWLSNESQRPDGYKPTGLNSDHYKRLVTTGWQPTCNCNAGEPVPATVLDPFNGSGTTGRAAIKLGRQYIGVDISREYLDELTPERLSNIQMQLI